MFVCFVKFAAKKEYAFLCEIYQTAFIDTVIFCLHFH